MELPIANVSFESKCIAYLSAVAKDSSGEITHRASSTRFFWRQAQRVYLVTARHCITGRVHENNPRGTFDPSELQVYFRIPGARIEPDANRYENASVAAILWKEGSPDWYEHSTGSKIDVAVLDFTSTGYDVHCVNDKHQIDDWLLEAGADCFIVGFPEAMAGSQGTPIWKRGSVASEPNLDYQGLPLFLCDSATRSGLSGAPVFAKLQGYFGQHGETLPNEGPKIFGHWTKFIGVYTGRNGNENDGFQLGRVWRSEVIEKIIKGKLKAQSPFQKHTVQTHGSARP